MNPTFSILIPTKNRPEQVIDAIASVLLQGGDDIELVVSNNGGDADTKAALTKWQHDTRLSYVEPPMEMSMPDHWEWASKMLKGKYIMILTDRCLLRDDSIAFLRKVLKQFEQPEVVSWKMGSYSEFTGILSNIDGGSELVIEFESSKLWQELRNGHYLSNSALPKGLNSCVRRDVYEKIRKTRGRVFDVMSPDFSSAFSVILESDRIYYISQPLAISRADHISNGGLASKGVDTGYINLLDAKELKSYVPLDSSIMSSSIYDDFIRTAAAHGSDINWHHIDHVNYFRECFRDIVVLHVYLPMRGATLRQIRKNFLIAIRGEGELEINVIKRNLALTFPFRDVFSCLLNYYFSKKMLDALRRLRHKYKKKVFYKNAMAAAGFTDTGSNTTSESGA